MHALTSEVRFLRSLWISNFKSAIEYRFNFFLQILFMILNNGVYIVFWFIFFSHFRSINGWDMSKMLLLFAVVTTGYGLSMFFFGNTTRIAEVITTGRLDRYLVLPKNPLLHVISARMSVRAIGDFVFGVLIFLFSSDLSLRTLLIWLACALNTALILTCFFTLSGLIAFWVGRADVLQQQAANGVVTFGLYPQTIYQGPAKWILFSVIPAGMIGYFPVQAILSPDWINLGIPLAFALFLMVVTIGVFYRGLRHYTSASTFTPVD